MVFTGVGGLYIDFYTHNCHGVENRELYQITLPCFGAVEADVNWREEMAETSEGRGESHLDLTKQISLIGTRNVPLTAWAVHLQDIPLETKLTDIYN